MRSIERISEFFIRIRVWVVVAIAILTGFFLYFAINGEVRTIFKDLMPSDHPYIKVHHEFKSSFGGSNMVSIMLKVEEGDIFTLEILKKIQDITKDLRMISGVNSFQIYSIAAKKVREVKAGSYGIKTKSLMWPYLPKSESEIEKLKQSVLSNRLVYGTYVSGDLKAALITVDFIERKMDFATVYTQVTGLVDKHRGKGYELSVVGEPILQGVIRAFLPETMKIFVLSIGALGLLLFIFFTRSLRGTFVPLLAACVSAIWATGIAALLGINQDPLGVVIAFLITARVISHSVQSVNRFDMIIAEGAETSRAAAGASLGQLFKPGLLSVITDAGGILVVAMAPIPLLQKAAVVGAIWVSCISVTGVILTPVLLSWVRHPRRFLNPWNMTSVINKALGLATRLSTSRAGYVISYGALALILVCGYIGVRIHIGDANQGSPLLWQDHPYNVAVTEINSRFSGTDRMFVVVRGDEKQILKDPEVLDNIVRFQRYCERQSEIGGTLSLADLIPAIKRVWMEGNPRYEEAGGDKLENGELFYVFLSGTEPGDLDRFSDVNYQHAGITIYFRDHKGQTIRTAISRIKDYIANNPMKGAHYELAGGLIGVLAAVNEVIFSGQVESIALALLVVLIMASITNRSGVAGIYFMVPILLSNTITFTYMVWRGIGLNVNSLPVAALGIGLGVDYAIYVVDAIKEDYACHGDMKTAIFHALNTAGRGVIMTATPLVACTIIWYMFSSLRFQAEMAILIALWMAVSAASALLVMPAMTYVLRPRFIVGDGAENNCITHLNPTLAEK
jgi:predicted RND superfamily exporter protein